MARVIERSIDISSSADAVWKVLIDFPRFPEWNPFISRIVGLPTPGARLLVDLGARDSPKRTMRPRVLRAVEDQELRWLGKLGFGGLFNGEHSFRIEAISPSKVRFVQSERFTGLLVPLLRGVIRGAEAGFEAMNSALKDRVERG
ncbi:MAG: SRPBCC family protein [Thermoplasmata archaeon]